nr:hypothetical protein [Tanacetum cinerariifolium]
MPAEDDILPVEEQPLLAAASPTTESPGQIDESDIEDDPEEDPVDYPGDGGEEAQRTEITDLRATDHRFQTTVGTQQEEIRELQAGHCKLQAQIIRALTVLKSCQTQLTAALGRIQILEAARVPTLPEVPEEAGS